MTLTNTALLWGDTVVALLAAWTEKPKLPMAPEGLNTTPAAATSIGKNAPATTGTFESVDSAPPLTLLNTKNCVSDASSSTLGETTNTGPPRLVVTADAGLTTGVSAIRTTTTPCSAGDDDRTPSLATNRTTRGTVGGARDTHSNTTDRTSVWYAPTLAVPVSASVPEPAVHVATTPGTATPAASTSPVLSPDATTTLADARVALSTSCSWRVGATATGPPFSTNTAAGASGGSTTVGG